MWRSGGPGSSAADRLEAKGEGGRSLRLRRRRTGRDARTGVLRQWSLRERRRSRQLPGPRRPGPAKLEAALPVGWTQPIETSCGGRGAGDHDRTLSCSCPAAKSKNFVSRARTTSLRCVVLSRLGSARPAPPRWPWRSGVVPGVVARLSEAAGGGARHQAGDSAQRSLRESAARVPVATTAAGGNCAQHISPALLCVWFPTAPSQPFPASVSGRCFRIPTTF